MEEHNIRCNWCQEEFDLSHYTGMLEHDLKFICPACLIPILPKSFLLEDKSNQQESPEKRIHYRYPILSTVYLAADSDQSNITKVLLLEFSREGMKIQMRDHLYLGENITLGVMTKLLRYKALGKLRHVKQIVHCGEVNYEAGIQLIGIHQDLREFI